MKIYKKIVLDKDNKIIEEDSYEYNGDLWMIIEGCLYCFNNYKNIKASNE